MPSTLNIPDALNLITALLLYDYWIQVYNMLYFIKDLYLQLQEIL